MLVKMKLNLKTSIIKAAFPGDVRAKEQGRV
jgi:hypothetical protein